MQDKSNQKNSSVVHEQTSGLAGVDGGEAGDCCSFDCWRMMQNGWVCCDENRVVMVHKHQW